MEDCEERSVNDVDAARVSRVEVARKQICPIVSAFPRANMSVSQKA